MSINILSYHFNLYEKMDFNRIVPFDKPKNVKI